MKLEISIDKKKFLRFLSIVAGIIIFFVLFSGGSKAETGSITVESTTTKAGYTDFGASGNQAPNYSKIYYDMANYNVLNDFYMVKYTTCNAITFALDFESTYFTISGGGTGGGYAWYDKNTTKIYYVFNSGNTYTASPINLSFSKNIFSNVTTDCTPTGSAHISRPNAPDVNHPIYLGTVGGTYSSDFIYTASVSSRATDQYNVTYPFNNGFSIEWIKGKKIATKWNILDANLVSYVIESSFDITDDTYTNNSYNGIIANVSIASGASTQVVINLSGTSGYIPPPPAPTVDPITGAGIIFDASSYSVGATANVSWLRTIATPISLEDHIEVRDPSDNVVYAMTNPPDSGYTKLKLNSVGMYKASFIRCSFFCLLTYTLDEATANVTAAQPSYILINSTIYAGRAENLTYFNGMYGAVNNLNVFWLDSSVEKYTLLDSLNAVTGTETTTSYTCYKVGTYKFELELSGAVAYAQCTASNNYAQFNITTSNLTLSSYSLAFGDWFTYSYQVDSVNWTNNLTRLSVLDKNSVEVFNLTLPVQKDDGIQVQASDTQGSFYYMRFGAGTNTIRLITDDGVILDSHTVTLSSINANGYGLQIKESFCTKDAKTFTYYAPDVVNVTIYDSNNKIVKNMALNLSSTGKIIPITLGIGEYEIRLYSSNNQLQMVRKTTVTSCAVTATPGFPGQNGTWTPKQDNIAPTCNFWDGWVQLIFPTQGVNDVTRFQFALILITIPMVFTILISRSFGAGVTVGFLPYAFFAYLTLSTPCGTYIPTWTVIFIALIIGIKMRWFS